MKPATARIAAARTTNIMVDGSSPLTKPESLLPIETNRNQPPIIRPTSRFGDSLVTSERPIGDRQSSPHVMIR